MRDFMFYIVMRKKIFKDVYKKNGILSNQVTVLCINSDTKKIIELMAKSIRSFKEK